jgi:tetratricopeptide (TPR) repeat protein
MMLAQGEIEELQRTLEGATGAARVEILNKLSSLTQLNAPRSSIGYAEQALNAASEIDESPATVEAYRNLGVGHYYIGEYNEALKHHRSALEVSEKLNYLDGIADALNNIGIIHYVWGEYDQSLDFYSRAVDMRRQMGDAEGLANGLNNLGTVYYAVDRLADSLKYFNAALSLYEELGHERLVAGSLNNIGLLSLKLEQYDDALEQLDRALMIEKRIGDLPGQALSLNTIGAVREALDDIDSALDHYEQSLAVRKSIDDQQGMVSCELSIGAAYTQLGDYDRASTFLTRALQKSQSMGVKEIERDVHLALSKLHELQRNFDAALSAFRSYKSVNDELFDHKTSNRIAELETRYEVEKKDREIQALTSNQQVQRMVRNAVLVGSVLLLLMILLLFNRHRVQARANEKINAAHEALAVAQAERARILERTNEGRQAAMDKGVKFGRKPHKGAEKAVKMIKRGDSAKEVMGATGVSRATYFRLKKTA